MDHSEDRMVKVYLARNAFEAHFVKDLLTSHGIDS